MTSSIPPRWKAYYYHTSSGFIEDDDLLDLRVVDTYNRFAREAKIQLRDPSGIKPNTYRDGTRVKLEVKPQGSGASYINRFGGFVVGHECREDTTNIDILSHDFWLKRRPVFEGWSGSTISGVLSGLINEYTPLTYDPSEISILNNRTITREWKGERLDVVLNEISNLSGNEYYGANNSGVFFFKERDLRHASKDFSGVQNYSSMEFKQDSTQELNRATIYYSGAVVTVEDLGKQKELQDELGTPRPVIREDAFEHPEITNEEAARRKGRSYIEGKETIRRGKIQTWDGYDITPSEVTSVTNSNYGLDGDDFRVASIEYRYLEDTTTIELAENQKGVNEILADINPEITRVDLKNIDSSLTPTRVNRILEDVDVSLKVSVYKESVSPSGFKFGEFGGGVGDNNPIGDNTISGTYLVSGVIG